MQKPSDSTAMMEKRFLHNPEKGGKIPATGHRSHTIDETGFHAGESGAWCSVKPSAIPRLFALIDAPHPDWLDMHMHMLG